jgi:hypothetical protein
MTNSFLIHVPAQLAGAIQATALLENKSLEEVVSSYVELIANKECQDFFVGPYYTGPIPPQFNADGTVYVAPAEPEPEEPAAPEEE